MAAKSILVVLVVSALSFVGVGLWAQPPQDPTSPTTVSNVYTGSNVGVRVIGGPDKNGVVQGRLMVRIDGRWVEVAGPPIVAK